MDLKLLKEVIEYLNEKGVMYQYHCRYSECVEMDMRPSECDEESKDYVIDELYSDFDGFDDVMANEIRRLIDITLECNDDFLSHPDIEIDAVSFNISKFGDGIRFY